MFVQTSNKFKHHWQQHSSDASLENTYHIQHSQNNVWINLLSHWMN